MAILAKLLLAILCIVVCDCIRLFPKPIAPSDPLHLLAFQYEGCKEAIKMEPQLRRLESELKIKVRRVNVDTLRDAQAVLDAVGHFEGGAFPFYYNRRTGQAVNGATNYNNLRKLAIGDTSTEFTSPMTLLETADDEMPEHMTGMANVLKNRLITTADEIERSRKKSGTMWGKFTNRFKRK